MVGRSEGPRVLHRVRRHVVPLFSDVHPPVIVFVTFWIWASNVHVEARLLAKWFCESTLTIMDSAFPGSMAQYYWLVKRRRNAAFAAGNTNRLLAPTCGHRTAQSTRPRPPAASTCPPRTTRTDSAAAVAAAGRRPPRSSATAAASASAWRTVSAARERRAREAEPPLSRNLI